MPAYSTLALAPPVFGFHKTRSGGSFSPWDADSGVPLHAPGKIHYDSLLHQSLADKARATKNGTVPHEDEPVLEDAEDAEATRREASAEPPVCEASIYSPFSSPLSSPPSSPPGTRPPSPLPATTATPIKTHPCTDKAKGRDILSKADFHKLVKVQHKRDKRRVLRKKKQEAAGHSLKAACMKYRSGGAVLSANFALLPENVHVASTGVIGRAIRVSRCQRKTMSLDDAKKLGFQYIRWSGRHPCLVVDNFERNFTTLIGQPRDPAWPQLVARATKRFEDAQKALAAVEAAVEHRRGGHFAVHTGISIGSGQQRVGNLKNPAHRQKVIDDFKKDPDIVRIANFGSGGLKNYVPKVHAMYKGTLDSLLESDPRLKPTFPNNAFAAATFNLGPRVATYPHLDHLNFAFGMCAITSLGKYDHQKGGHIILWDAKLIIEFPPGATILIPSAILRHSNVAVADGETRYSLTQYFAGGLFRWVKCGFRTLKAYRAAGFDLESEYDEWREGWRLYSTVSELRSTPATVL